MILNLNTYTKLFIDSKREDNCRAAYILKCIRYIRENDIDINDYYEGMSDYEKLKGFNKEGEDINKL